MSFGGGLGRPFAVDLWDSPLFSQCVAPLRACGLQILWVGGVAYGWSDAKRDFVSRFVMPSESRLDHW